MATVVASNSHRSWMQASSTLVPAPYMATVALGMAMTTTILIIIIMTI